MAYQRDITDADQIFYDTDRALVYTVAEGNPTTEDFASNAYIPADVSAYDLTWVLKKTAKSAVVLIEKSTTNGGLTVTGTYDADPVTNTQRVRVLIQDTDFYGPELDPVPIVPPGVYQYALKRLDAGAETILAWGSFEIILAAAWE